MQETTTKIVLIKLFPQLASLGNLEEMNDFLRTFPLFSFSPDWSKQK